MIEYYKTVAGASDVPLLIYNIPQRTRITMTEGLFTRLLEIPNVVGMKDSSGDIFSLGNLVAKTGDPVIFEGEDATVLWALMAGAKGGIGSTYNVMPHLYVRMWRAFQDGRTDDAVATQLRINEFIAVLITSSVISTVMKTMEFIGLPCGRAAQPEPGAVGGRSRRPSGRTRRRRVLRRALADHCITVVPAQSLPS